MRRDAGGRRGHRPWGADPVDRQMAEPARYADGEARTTPLDTVHPHVSPVQLDELRDECQPDPRPLVRPCARALDPMKAIEEMRKLCRRDAGSRVSNDDFEVVVEQPQRYEIGRASC